MQNYLLGYVALHALFSWRSCIGSIYFDDAHLGKVCVNNSPCYDYNLAHFGAIERYSTQGFVYPAAPINACVAVDPNTCKDSLDIACFLLVQEGGCSFGYKALMAKNAQYQFVIIYNTESDKLKDMPSDSYGKEVGADIMAIYVGKTAGLDLLRNNYTTGNLITITPPPFFPDLEYYLIPFVIIVGICFIVMAMFMVTRYYKSYLEKRRNRITPANLKKIPTRKFKKGDDYYDVCAICLDDYKDGDKIRILPCDHVYHCKCVDPWLTEGKKTCPVCKQPVESTNTPERRQDSESEADEHTPLIHPSPSAPSLSMEV
ncbi:hypothetical protein QZH41_014468 [Actinostola sp. cb2023]|nr:hypothetical protein QZH41_014468 [Actinostola sp. cb2023]